MEFIRKKNLNIIIKENTLNKMMIRSNLQNVTNQVQNNMLEKREAKIKDLSIYFFKSQYMNNMLN